MGIRKHRTVGTKKESGFGIGRRGLRALTISPMTLLPVRSTRLPPCWCSENLALRLLRMMARRLLEDTVEVRRFSAESSFILMVDRSVQGTVVTLSKFVVHFLSAAVRRRPEAPRVDRHNTQLPWVTQDITPRGVISKAGYSTVETVAAATNGGVGTVSSRAFRTVSIDVYILFVVKKSTFDTWFRGCDISCHLR